MAQTSLLRPEGLVQSPAFSHFDMKAFRPVRMLGSVLALLAGVFWLERLGRSGTPKASRSPDMATCSRDTASACSPRSY
jgi:hypothetical protein